MARSFKTEGFVLKKKNLLGKDMLVILFSQEEGKIPVLAKGIKKITSRRSPHLQTGNLVQVELHKKNDIYYLQGSNLITGFSELKKDSEKINKLYNFLYVLERLLPERQKEDKVYVLTKSFLIKLSTGKDKDEIITDFLNKLLKLLGYSRENHNFSQLEEIISELIGEKIPSFSI